MKFTGFFTTATINIDKYEEELKAHLKRELHAVASDWIEAVTGRVPVWSGMSQGSLLELAELINETLIISSIGGVKSRIDYGKALGSAKPNYNLKDFKITITTNVEHYNIQEFKNVGVSKSAPWHSLIAGKDAALKRMNNVKLIIPKIESKRITI